MGVERIKVFCEKQEVGDYKDILLKHLSEAGWEQAEAMTTTQWWGSEIWRVRSVTTNWGFELFLSFMNDPFPGLTAGGASAWSIELTADDPCETAGAAKLGIISTKQKDLIRELPEFLGVMDGLRRAQAQK